MSEQLKQKAAEPFTPFHLSGLVEPAPGIKIMRLTPPEGQGMPDYRAGQYAMLALDSQSSARPYSIANAPNGDYIEFHINCRHSSEKQQRLDQLQIGDTLYASLAYGECTLIQDCPLPVLAVAGGLGLAPLKAIIQQALNHNHPRQVILYHGVRTASDAYDLANLQEMAHRHGRLHLVTALSESTPQDANSFRLGRIDDLIADDFADLSPYRIYMSGPPAMVEAVRRVAVARGAVSSQIHWDRENLMGL